MKVEILFMEARSAWLKYTRDYSKQNIFGRKFFKMHKNDHNCETFGVLNSYRTPTNRNSHYSPKFTSSHSPLKNNSIISSQSFTKVRESFFNESLQLQNTELAQKLNQADKEIKGLKQLYKKINEKLLYAEKYHYEAEIIKNLTRNQESQLKNEKRLGNLSSNNLSKKHEFLPELKSVKRNQSTLNHRAVLLKGINNSYTFKQPNYTKKHPKMLPTNPITGVLL